MSEAEPNKPAEAPLRSVHTTSFARLLAELGISILVTTYQAGKLVVLREDGNGGVNTHFRAFRKPMGLAVQKDRFAIGTAGEIHEYHNVPAVAAKLEPPGKHDAAYLPRTIHTTGDVQIHEMGWGGGDELWFVNTRFSCLCNRAVNYSFVPRWRPPFVSALAAEDRCHLNGLAMVNGKPAYVTALGETDTAGGWRANKKAGGILIELWSNEILCRGLSMPHSPRWYRGQLWVLESGGGGVGVVDLATGKYQQVATLPGFTRGIDFFGNFAFIGLSQVRESATFSGLAITDLPVEKRACGVWVIDIRSGQIAAFLQFQDAVQEIFAVAVLDGQRYPDVVNEDPAILANSFVLPDEALGHVASG
jgi:uncharacterized protein (TIGR03032 family)